MGRPSGIDPLFKRSAEAYLGVRRVLSLTLEARILVAYFISRELALRLAVA